MISTLLPTTPDSTFDISRRSLLFGATAGAALLVTGCGAEDDSAPSGSAGPATRNARGAYGPVEVPAQPRRVVTMYPTDTDIALALGFTIVAAPGATGSANQPFAAYQADQLQGVQRIDASFEPDFEAIAAARPDLIIDSALSPSDRKGYDKLSRIAPVLAYEPTDWRDYLGFAAKAFGRGDVAADTVAEFEARADEVRAALPARVRDLTFASVFILPGEVIVADRTAQVHRVLRDELGLTLHPLTDRTPEKRVTLALENLGQLDADVLVIPAYPKEDSLARDRTELDKIEKQPVWQQLRAVRSDAIVLFDGELVYTSPLTASTLLEQLGDQLRRPAF